MGQIIADGYESIIAIDVSDHLSSTISTISLVLAEHPEIPSYVLNTKNISIGSTMAMGCLAADRSRDADSEKGERFD